ncbi:DUF3472 domain-containing protein [Rahnella sp. SAP-1]|uniref:DUF3472 domain-containing protein n=1 Tax=Rouxiella aceris TaxID=2703884 RepID=A0A848MET9_9GAMM|nr:carbohydrate-binding protein [Rouxiella aceris]NMP25630.1 DUF3472 domain-containing protein [Rouxiella aceris]
MKIKIKPLRILIAMSLMATGMPAAMAHNDQGTTATPTIYFATHPNMKASNSLSSVSATMEVQEMTSDTAPWYWAYQGWFMSEGAFYFGLQPNGHYGKTALFSVFGKGTQSSFSSCKGGADSTNPDTGMSCHIPYDWEIGHKYTFNVKRINLDAKQSLATWKGIVTDQTTGEQTTIGEIKVPARWSDIVPSIIGWAEWFQNGGLTCAQRTNFVVNYSAVSGVYSNSSSPWHSYVSGTTANTCATYDKTGPYPAEVTMSAGGTFNDSNNPGPGVIKPVAVVPADFTVTQSSSSAGYPLDGSDSKNAQSYSWKIVQGAGDFWLQEKQGGIWLREVKQAKARALVPANKVGTAVYELTVTGKDGTQDARRVTVTVKAANNKPEIPADAEYPAWKQGTTYVAGNKVTYEGVKYIAKYWTNERPANSNAWNFADPNYRSEWSPSKAYSGGAHVSYQGKNYKAAYWTQGNTPGQHAVWIAE